MSIVGSKVVFSCTGYDFYDNGYVCDVGGPGGPVVTSWGWTVKNGRVKQVVEVGIGNLSTTPLPIRFQEAYESMIAATIMEEHLDGC